MLPNVVWQAGALISADTDQHLGFNIITGNSSVGKTNGFMSALANLTTTRPGGLQYSVTGTSSVTIPEINITPKIWLKNVTGDVLVYTGIPVKCPDTSACSATGLFTPISNATYFANATILYTVPAGTTNGAAGTQQYAIATKSGGVSGSGYTYWYVFADGVSLYHGDQPDLSVSNKTPGEFYDKIVGKCGDKYPHTCWKGIAKPIDDTTGSKNWNKSEDADNYANKADFSLHAGHGGNDGINFGTKNGFMHAYRWDMKFNQAKWVGFVSCSTLNASVWQNWKSVFDGAHIVMGYDTVGYEGDYQGKRLAQYMTAQDDYKLKSIRIAWEEMLKDTVNRTDTRGSYIYVDPCGDDYLPGWGSYCSAPTKNGGTYSYTYVSFSTSRSG